MKISVRNQRRIRYNDSPLNVVQIDGALDKLNVDAAAALGGLVRARASFMNQLVAISRVHAVLVQAIVAPLGALRDWRVKWHDVLARSGATRARPRAKFVAHPAALLLGWRCAATSKLFAETV